MKQVLLVGPYGGRNLGDNLILELILKEFGRACIRPVVACSDPTTVSEIHGVESCGLLEYRRLRMESLRRLKAVDALVIGGGEQLAEPRLPNPIWGHLANVAHMVRAARSCAKPVMLWSVGLDQLRAPVSRWLLRSWVCNPDVLICLRDGPSVERMQCYCGSAREGLQIFRSADPAFGLASQSRASARNWLYREAETEDRGKQTLLLVPANDKLADTSYVQALAEYGARQARAGWQVFGLVTDLQATYDGVVKRWDVWKGINGFAWLPATLYSADELARIAAGCDLMVSARMHPLIIALTQSTPSVVLARSAKMRAFAQMCGLHSMPTAAVTLDGLAQLCTRAIEEGYGAQHEQALDLRRAEAAVAAEVFRTRLVPSLAANTHP